MPTTRKALRFKKHNRENYSVYFVEIVSGVFTVREEKFGNRHDAHVFYLFKALTIGRKATVKI